MKKKVILTIFHPSAFLDRVNLFKFLKKNSIHGHILILDSCINDKKKKFLKKNKVSFTIIQHSETYLSYYLRKINKSNNISKLILIFFLRLYKIFKQTPFYFFLRSIEINKSEKKIYNIVKNYNIFITSNHNWRTENIILTFLAKKYNKKIFCCPHDLYTKEEEYISLKRNKKINFNILKFFLKKKWFYKNFLPANYIDILIFNIKGYKFDDPWMLNNDADMIFLESKGHYDYLKKQGCNFKKIQVEKSSKCKIKKKRSLAAIFIPPDQNAESTPNFDFKNYQDLVFFIIKNVETIIKIKKIYLLHPRSLYLKKSIEKKFNIKIASKNYLNYLSQAKFFFTWHSSTIKQMLAQNVPILYFDPWKYFLKFPDDKICLKSYTKKKMILDLKKIQKIKIANKKRRFLTWNYDLSSRTNLLREIKRINI